MLTLRANKMAGAAQITATQAYAAALDATQQTSSKQIEALEALVERLNEAQSAPADLAPAAPHVPPVRWSLQRDGKNRWFLRNDGDATARQALIRPVTAQDAQDLHVILETAVDIAPGAQLPFAIWRSLASPPATLIEVVWSDEQGDSHSTTFVVSV